LSEQRQVRCDRINSHHHAREDTPPHQRGRGPPWQRIDPTFLRLAHRNASSRRMRIALG